MSALKSIALAIELADRERDEAVKGVAQAQRAVAFALQQMEQLESYANDTDARWLQSQARAVPMELMRHHYQFMDRLQQAITLQTSVIGNARRQVEVNQQLLVKAEHRLAGLNQVHAARLKKLQLQQARREQQQTDEFASLRYVRRLQLARTGGNP